MLQQKDANTKSAKGEVTWGELQEKSSTNFQKSSLRSHIGYEPSQQQVMTAHEILSVKE